jgi:hypothetical protein
MPRKKIPVPDFRPDDGVLILETSTPGRVKPSGWAVFEDGRIMDPKQLAQAWRAHRLGWAQKRYHPGQRPPETTKPQGVIKRPPAPGMAPAGWYRWPHSTKSRERYWDGRAWGEERERPQ